MAAAKNPHARLAQAKDAMEKSLQHLKDDLRKIRTGRANPALRDPSRVDYYGTPTPLNQMANLSAPDPRMIVISPFDKSQLQTIEKAIQASNLGLTPNNAGRVVRIPTPPLTEQRRKEFVKQLRAVAEQHKVGVREARRDAPAAREKLGRDGRLPAGARL